MRNILATFISMGAVHALVAQHELVPALLSLWCILQSGTLVVPSFA